MRVNCQRGGEFLELIGSARTDGSSADTDCPCSANNTPQRSLKACTNDLSLPACGFDCECIGVAALLFASCMKEASCCQLYAGAPQMRFNDNAGLKHCVRARCECVAGVIYSTRTLFRDRQAHPSFKPPREPEITVEDRLLSPVDAVERDALLGAISC